MNRIPPAERRKRLLEAAFRVISEHGVAAATTRAVSAEAGMPLASFHYVFTSQQELMGELIEAVAVLESEAISIEVVSDDPAEAISAMYAAYLDMLFSHAGEEMAFIELNQYAQRTPGMEELAQLRHLSTRQVTAQAIDQIEAKFGPSKIPREELLDLVVTLNEGLTMFWLATRNDEAARTTSQHIARFLMEVAVGGENGEPGAGS